MIYFDASATSFLKPDCVGKAVARSFLTMGNAGRGAHAPTLQASRIIYATRELLAELFGIANASRIAFTNNATEALNIAISGLIGAGDQVITTSCEHNSVLRPLYRKEKEGCQLTILPVDTKGNIGYDQLEQSISQETKAVVITHASNVTGNVHDIQKVSKIIRDKSQAILIVDASQTAGLLPIDVEKMGIDVLCFTGHKGLLGPQGTGGIYVREGIEIPSFKVGGSGVRSFDKEHPPVMPTALEAGSLNGHGIAGLHAALHYLKEVGIPQIHARENVLMQRFYQGIRDIPGIKIYADMDLAERAPIVSFNIGDMDSAMVSDILWEDYEICTRPGAHCAPLMHESFGTEDQGIVRCSFSFFNTEEEIDQGIEAVREIAEE